MSTHDEPIKSAGQPPRDDSPLKDLWHDTDALRSSQRQDFDVFRAEMAAEFAALHATLGTPPGEPLEPAGETVADTADAAGDEQVAAESESGSATSRRTLLKWGGLGAAAALTAAGGATFTSQTAHAADGAGLVLGSATNKAEHLTSLTYNGSETAPQVFKVATTADDSVALQANAGDNSANAAYGIFSTTGNGASAYGARGIAGSDGTGVRGVAKGSQSFGLWGDTLDGYGVSGDGGTGLDLAAIDSGRIWQFPAGIVGAPTAGSYLAGEQIRDVNGDLFICIVGGSPGTWKKVAALDTHYKGGGIVFLSTPIRVYDSRQTGGALIGNATRDVQVTGVLIGGVQVPKGASGCIGNLTVTGTSASGYVVIYPHGSSTPTTSSVNFLTGQTVANAFSVGLSGTGAVTVHSFTKGQCHFIVDINGFII